MKALLTIFKKELIDTLRDRRTIIAMIVVPLLVFPLLIGVTTKISISQAKKAKEKKLKVAVIDPAGSNKFVETLSSRDDVRLIENVDPDSIRSLIRSDSLDGAFVFSRTFTRQVQKLRSGRVKFYFKSTEDREIEKKRMTDFIEDFEKQLLAERFSKMDLDKNIVKAINLVEVDIATTQEKIGKAIGGFLPYIFVLFCFIGAMYPAIDMAAGEKERGTIETLLTAPVSRFQILLGKFGTVVVTGIGSAVVSIFGLYLGIRMATEIPPELTEVLKSILEPRTIILLVSLLLPLTMFFAGILLSLSMFARTFKEAQSIITPFNIVIILPVAIGLLPGITLNKVTAWIPILNVSLATKEIIAGTIQYGLLALVYLSLAILAGASLFLASKLFLRESVIFR